MDLDHQLTSLDLETLTDCRCSEHANRHLLTLTLLKTNTVTRSLWNCLLMAAAFIVATSELVATIKVKSPLCAPAEIY